MAPGRCPVRIVLRRIGQVLLGGRGIFRGSGCFPGSGRCRLLGGRRRRRGSLTGFALGPDLSGGRSRRFLGVFVFAVAVGRSAAGNRGADPAQLRGDAFRRVGHRGVRIACLAVVGHGCRGPANMLPAGTLAAGRSTTPPALS